MKIIKSLIGATLLVLASPGFSAQININTADADALNALDGVGPSKAAAIVEYRETHGPYQSVDDLIKVDGIGPSTVEDNRNVLTIGQELQ